MDREPVDHAAGQREDGTLGSNVEGATMIKLFVGLAVVVGILVGAHQAMDSYHSSHTPAPSGPVQVNVSVPNPLGGQSDGGKLYVP